MNHLFSFPARWSRWIVFVATVIVGSLGVPPTAGPPQRRNPAATARPKALPKIAREADRIEVCNRITRRLRSDIPSFIAPRDPTQEVPRWLRAQRPDGSWPDILMSDPTPGNWSTAEHLRRTTVLAATGRVNEAASGLRFWLDRDPQSSNWWWNRLYVPKALGQIVLLLDAAGSPLSSTQRRSISLLMERGGTELTGQNRVWQAEVLLLAGCVESNPEVLSEGFALIESELSVGLDEGIQPDFSFHQHGPLIYNGGYGLPFLIDNARFANLARGTAYAFDSERITTLSNLFRFGTAWMIRGPVFDFGVIGREIARPGKSAEPLREATADLAALDPHHAADFHSTTGPTGNRHFWRSDYLAHRRSNYLISVRMASSRVWRSDGVWADQEGQLSHHLADGATAIFRHGQEYWDIFPLWNWKRVPGVTALFDGSSMKTEDVRQMGTQEFVGGLSDGEYGLAAMDFVRDGLRAQKAWFLQDEGLIALGAGLTSERDGWVATTLNQTHKRGAIWIGGDGRGTRTWDTEGDSRFNPSQSPTWIHHDEVGYVLRSARLGIRLEQGATTGNWNRITNGVGNRPVRGELFTLGLEHGQRPSDETYIYAVLPGISKEELETRWSGPTGGELGRRVIVNTKSLQAVQDPERNLIQAVFWRAGELITPEGERISVSEPCALQIRMVGERETRRILLTVSLPDQRIETLQIRLNRWLQCDGCARSSQKRETTLLVQLPQGTLAGSSLTRSIPVLD